MSNIEFTLTDSQIDAAIMEIDAVMNGFEPGDVVAEFLPVPTEKMRAIIRKMITSAAK